MNQPPRAQTQSQDVSGGPVREGSRGTLGWGLGSSSGLATDGSSQPYNTPAPSADLGPSPCSHGPRDSHSCWEHEYAAFSESLNVFFSLLGLSPKPTHCFPVRPRDFHPSTELNCLPSPITFSLIHPTPLFTSTGPDLAASWTLGPEQSSADTNEVLLCRAGSSITSIIHNKV